MVILHEHEIRKKEGQFKLLNKESRDLFFKELSGVIADTEFTFISIVIDKKAIRKSNDDLILFIFTI